MTRVIFYIGVAERYRFLRRFLHRKIFIPQQTGLIYTSDAEMDELDRELWDDVFLPHQRLSDNGDTDDSGIEAPIVLASTIPAPEFIRDILILCAAEVPEALIGRFETCVDIVGGSEESKRAGRRRYRYFQDHGYNLEIVDMGQR